LAERRRVGRIISNPPFIFLFFLHDLNMKKLQPGDEIVKVDKELGIAWIRLPPDTSLGGFRGISPRIMDEKKFIAAKKKSEKGND